MYKITLTHQHFSTPSIKRYTPRKRGFQTKCAKCGVPLHLGQTAYRMRRALLCEPCGVNAEID